MFGYVKPDQPYLYMKDDKLYKSLYCGVCKSIGKCCGEFSRMTLTFDVAFLSAIAHNIMGIDVEIKNSRCVLHPIVARPIAKRDGLTDILASLNVMLAYYKVEDDIIDSSKGNFKKLLLKRGYSKAKKRCPDFDKVIKENYSELRKMEQNGFSSIDMISEPFANMLKALSVIVLGVYSNENSENLFYFLGKWIYLIDALDDYDKDIKKKNFNPFVKLFQAENAKSFLQKHGSEIAFIFGDIFKNINDNFNLLEFKFNKDLVQNILLKGLPLRTQKIFERITKNDKTV